MSTTSGVSAPQGYTAQADTMVQQARAIHDAAEDAKSEVKDLQPTKVAEKDFGTKHGQWHGQYSLGIEQVGKAADTMCASLVAFANSIGSAGKSYSAAESAQADAARRSGSGL
ncbi:hypothetical protein [Amycolatopsis arida]|uniref:hypothetical protein n=1 Tax=Amycolatopsis arida TaxID=587909 RepID=UPI001FB90075|nr:hypothetical protein [Amycolatopsis arida]